MSDVRPGDPVACGCDEGRRLTLSRRTLFKALGGTALVGATLGDVQLAFGATAGKGGHVLVTVVLSGGMDGLTVVPPLGDPGYAAARPVIAVPQSAAMRVDRMFGLHPALTPLYPYWRKGTFGVVHAVGQEAPTRSHFEAMEELERAAPDSTLRTGWLDRTLGALPMTTALEAVALGDSAVPGLLRGEHPKLAAGSLGEIRLPVDDDVTPTATWRKIFATLHSDARPEVRAPLATLVNVVETLNKLPEPEEERPPPPPKPPAPPPSVTRSPTASPTRTPPAPASASPSASATSMPGTTGTPGVMRTPATPTVSPTPSTPPKGIPMMSPNAGTGPVSGTPTPSASSTPPPAPATTAPTRPPTRPAVRPTTMAPPPPPTAVTSPSMSEPPPFAMDGPAQYPGNGFGQGLRDIARLIKADVGLRVASVGRGGWDYHTGVGNVGDGMARDVNEVALGLAAFADDLGPAMDRVTVVTLTEFGRRVEQNGNNGLDHGHGFAVLLLGGGIQGGRVHGTWPTLAAGSLDEGDLAATTDYRSILAEILVEQMGVGSVADVFPKLPAKRLGIVRP